MTHLYELSQQLRELEEIDPEGETMALAIANTIAGIQGEFDEKAKAVAAVITNIEADIASISLEIERLDARKKAMHARRDGIREYLRDNMERCGITKITHPLFTITLAKGRDCVVIDDEAALPDDLVVVKTEIRPDKTEILRRLKTGDVPGAHIEKSRPTIQIR